MFMQGIGCRSRTTDKSQANSSPKSLQFFKAVVLCAIIELTMDFFTAGAIAWWGSNFSSCHIPACLDLNPVGTEEGHSVTETWRLDTAEQGEKRCQQYDQETKQSSLPALITKPSGCRSFLPFTWKIGHDSSLEHHGVGTFTFPSSTFPAQHSFGISAPSQTETNPKWPYQWIKVIVTQQVSLHHGIQGRYIPIPG